jgi:TonB family protein
MHLHRGIVQFFLCLSVALAASPLARAQEAVTVPFPEHSGRVNATPTPSSEKPTSEPVVEIISTKTPSQKPAPVAEQTPSAQELASPAATAEKKTRVKRHATPAAQPTAAELPVADLTSTSAVKAVTVSAPRPEYPYELDRDHITGSGVWVLSVDKASGKVASAAMAQSTGNAILDKVTTDTFRRWRFKPGTVSQVRVPISYE